MSNIFNDFIVKSNFFANQNINKPFCIIYNENNINLCRFFKLQEDKINNEYFTKIINFEGIIFSNISLTENSIIFSNNILNKKQEISFLYLNQLQMKILANTTFELAEFHYYYKSKFNMLNLYLYNRNLNLSSELISKINDSIPILYFVDNLLSVKLIRENLELVTKSLNVSLFNKITFDIENTNYLIMDNLIDKLNDIISSNNLICDVHNYDFSTLKDSIFVLKVINVERQLFGKITIKCLSKHDIDELMNYIVNNSYFTSFLNNIILNSDNSLKQALFGKTSIEFFFIRMLFKFNPNAITLFKNHGIELYEDITSLIYIINYYETDNNRIDILTGFSIEINDIVKNHIIY